MRPEESYLQDKKLAARFLGTSVQTVDRLTRSGELPYVRIGKSQIRFRPEDLAAYVQQRRVQQAAEVAIR
jgi:excisionase family DNA binding protein